MKRKCILSKLTASAISALMLFGGTSAAQSFNIPTLLPETYVSANADTALENTSELQQTVVMKGKKAVVSLSAAGGSGNYKYSVYYRRSSVTKWKTAGTDTTEQTVSITPKYAEEYTVSVKAVDSSGKSIKKYLTLEVLPALKNNSELEQTKVIKGKKAVVDLDADGGSGNYKYSVYYTRSSAAKWTTAVNDTTEQTVSITPKYAEEYTISVKAVDSLGNSKKKYLTLNSLAPVRNTSDVPQTTIYKGQKAVINCSAENGSGIYKYSVFYKLTSSKTWLTLIKDTTKSTVYFTTTAEGSYDISVKAADSLGSTDKKYFTVRTASQLKNTSYTDKTITDIGNKINIYASAEGGKAPYTYAYYYKVSDDTSWKKIKDYSLTECVNFYPQSPAEYNIKVLAKDSDGNVSEKILTIGFISEITNKSSINKTSVEADETIRIYPRAEGYYKNVSYQIYYTVSGSTAKTYIRYDSSSSYAEFKPSKAGAYTITVIAKDSISRTSSKSFGVTVNKNTLYETVDGVLAQIITPNMNELEKIKAIHDWMINYADYDKDGYYSGNTPSTDYTAEGFFATRKAVCDGYAKAFLVMAERAGLEAIGVEGQASTSTGLTEPHAWNQVKANGEWYNIDVTWDDPIMSDNYERTLNYTYFLVPDSILNQDHIAESFKNTCTTPQPNDWLIPLVVEEAQQESGYTVCTTDAELTSAVQKFKKNGVNPFTFIWKTDTVDCNKIAQAYQPASAMSFSWKQWKFEGYWIITVTLK